MNEAVSLCAERSQTAKTLTTRELSDIHIDRSLPLSLRVQKFVADIRDPYHFTINGTDVRVSFAGDLGIAACLAASFSYMIG